MDRLRQQLLARAALAADEDRIVRHGGFFGHPNAATHALGDMLDIAKNMLCVKAFFPQVLIKGCLDAFEHDLILKRDKVAEPFLS